jgi:hypothetical protein
MLWRLKKITTARYVFEIHTAKHIMYGKAFQKKPFTWYEYWGIILGHTDNHLPYQCSWDFMAY